MSQVAFTVQDVVTYALDPVDGNETCKTIILAGKKSRNLVAVLLRGTSKIDFSKAKALFGETMEIATAEEVKAVAGVDPGAVCPFMLTTKLNIDKKVLELGRINCGSGDHLYGLHFDLNKLLSSIEPKHIDIAKE